MERTVEGGGGGRRIRTIKRDNGGPKTEQKDYEAKGRWKKGDRMKEKRIIYNTKNVQLETRTKRG